MITGLSQNKYICIINNSKAQIKIRPGFHVSKLKGYKKYRVTQLRWVTGRVVDLLSAL